MLTLKPRKPYYAFKYFNELYKLKNQVEVSGEIENVYCVGATDGEEVSVAITYYNEKEGKEDVEFGVELKNLKKDVEYKATYYLTGKRYKNKKLQERLIKNGELLDVKMSQFDNLLIKLSPIK
jgi:hypothetical protein